MKDLGVYLLWIPLGAGGVGFVRFNGRVYEAFDAWRHARPRCELYHTALEVVLPEGRFTVENAWPSPDGDGDSRGVVGEGPVFSWSLSRFRAFRYEVRCWLDGCIPDASSAVVTPVASDADHARRILDLVPLLPPMVWGRDDAQVGEMWNSNSVISWVLTRAGVDVSSLRPPERGRAPGWSAGIAIARRGTGAANLPRR